MTDKEKKERELEAKRQRTFCDPGFQRWKQLIPYERREATRRLLIMGIIQLQG